MNNGKKMYVFGEAVCDTVCGAKWYHKDDGSKFKCFDNLRDILCLLPNEDYKLFEVEAAGEITSTTYESRFIGEYFCTEIRLVREVTDAEIRRYIRTNIKSLVNDDDSDVRYSVARYRFKLDELSTDACWWVRVEVVKQGHITKRLIDDEDARVRLEVAKFGYGYKKLSNDPCYAIRAEIAKQGCLLHKLINDENEYVRAEVAKQGYGLSKLVYDKSWVVRREVALQRFGLDILVDDEDPTVSMVAMKMRLE